MIYIIICLDKVQYVIVQIQYVKVQILIKMENIFCGNRPKEPCKH